MKTSRRAALAIARREGSFTRSNVNFREASSVSSRSALRFGSVHRTSDTRTYNTQSHVFSNNDATGILSNQLKNQKCDNSILDQLQRFL